MQRSQRFVGLLAQLFYVTFGASRQSNKASLCLQLEYEIKRHMDLLRRDARVRVKQWLDKLRQAFLHYFSSVLYLPTGTVMWGQRLVAPFPCRADRP